MLPSTQSKISAFVYLVAAGGCLSLLSACGGEPVEQSSESFSAMADVHNDARVIESTAEIDKLLVEQDPDGNWSASVFEPDTVLLDRTDSASDVSASNYGADESASAMSPGQRSPYYGDLHVHTEYSFDGYAMGTQATPYDAYRFAKGEAITNPGGFDMQLSRPLDFYAVTDHAMFLGLAKASAETRHGVFKERFCIAVSRPKRCR